jgi:hypothetical protein
MAHGTFCSCRLCIEQYGPIRPPRPPKREACGEPVIAALTFACVHEHVDTALSCAACVCELQRVSDALICHHCEDGASSHQCPQTMQIRWLTGEGAEAP